MISHENVKLRTVNSSKFYSNQGLPNSYEMSIFQSKRFVLDSLLVMENHRYGIRRHVSTTILIFSASE